MTKWAIDLYSEEEMQMNDTCGYCDSVHREGKCSGETDPAPCPFLSEILGDNTPCNCCENQQARCRDDI